VFSLGVWHFLGNGMVEVKNVVCRISRHLPAICGCAPSGRIGATVTCSVGIPLSRLTVGASAHFLPCGDPASFGYRAWAANRVSRALFIIMFLFLYIYIALFTISFEQFFWYSQSYQELASRTWTAAFNVNMQLPAPPAGFSIGIASVTTRAEISGAVRRGRLTANLALGVCGSFMFVGSCCNTDCPYPMSRALLPVRLLTGTFDFSDLCW
jgi:hypothetical protein